LNKDTDDEEGEENIEAENDICLPPPTLEVKEQINTIKNNRAPGVDNITGEMIKYGGNEILKHISTLIHKIWMEEKMPEEWSIAVICPIHKKEVKWTSITTEVLLC
jgi:hypothetical protein